MEARQSVWQEQVAVAGFPTVQGAIEADVVIIGAGLTGLLTASRLTAAGKKVVVLERARVGSGTSGYTTAHVTALLDGSYADITSKFGKAGAQLAARSVMQAIDELEMHARSLGTTFARRTAYHYAHDKNAIAELREECEAARTAGLATQFVDTIAFPGAHHGGIVLANQAELQPLELMAAIASTLSTQGCRIFEKSPVVRVTEGEPCWVECEEGHVTARDVVMATHTPVGFSLLQTEVAPYRSYVVAAKVATPIAPGLYFDTAEPYHYTRTLDPSTIIVGGADHKTGHGAPADAFADMERYVGETFPGATVEKRWSSQYYEPADHLPYIGRTHGHVFTATGFSGDGMPFAAVASRVLSDLITGRVSAEAELYAPTRVKPIAGGKKLIEENFDVARHLIGDRLSPAEAKSLDDVGRGEGRLVQLNGRKLAAYRDESGALSVVSAVCTHMKCIVRFNGEERTWDCPCHGGRFDVHGNVIDGPPVKALAPVET
jgi:glycine/D-amino acid oxidase-like deaminating enzyme/nitrite reductase/ring-hydroxylating ferredoxin subunit